MHVRALKCNTLHVPETSIIMKQRRSPTLSSPSTLATSYPNPDQDWAMATIEMGVHIFVAITMSQTPESTVISISCRSGRLTMLILPLRIGVRI